MTWTCRDKWHECKHGKGYVLIKSAGGRGQRRRWSTGRVGTGDEGTLGCERSVAGGLSNTERGVAIARPPRTERVL